MAPRSPVWSLGPASGETVGPVTTISPSGCELDARAEERDAGGRDLRAGLGQPVGRGDGDAGVRRRAGAARVAAARRRAAPSAARAGWSRPASSRRVSVVGTSETTVGPCGSSSACEHAVGLEALVDDRGRAVDRGAQQDRQAADVAQRQRAEPALVGVDAERDRAAQRAPEPVAVGEADRLGLGRGPAGVDEDRGRVEVVGRRARSGSPGAAGSSPSISRSTAGRSAAVSRRSTGTTSAPASRQACSATT